MSTVRPRPCHFRFPEPNCQVFDVLEEGESLVLILELLEGQSLAERLRTGISTSEALQFERQILGALQALHDLGIVESGGGRNIFGGSPHRHEAANGKISAEDAGLAFSTKKGITATGAEALKGLRALPAESIVDGLNLATQFQSRETFSGPMIDGKLRPEDPQEVYLGGKQQRVPVI